MKVVLDTNVIVSGLISRKGPPGRIIRAWRGLQFDLVLSEGQLAEIERVLCYPKIRHVLKWDAARVARFTERMGRRSLRVNTRDTVVEVPRDPADSPILAALIASKAEYLVTGDLDLLALRHSYPIIAPAEFVKKLRLTKEGR